MMPSVSEDLIFVSIASYRDPQLTATIESCLHMAAHPERLRIGICRQFAEGDREVAYRNDPRFRILDIPWQKSRGACWARAETMELWDGEPWFLQVDSHCRFRCGWDEVLIGLATEAESKKPILSTYATPFTPGTIEVLEATPLQMALQGFTPDGIPYFRPVHIPQWETLKRPLRARFLSAGFLFAPGSFVKEVPYDPHLYFLGEEAAMTLRAFTHGYDLFHPPVAVLWHDYVRASDTKHWDDHTDSQTRETWQARDLVSKERVRRLLAGLELDGFPLGTSRTLSDYETYAGLSLRHRKAQGYTMRAEEPPNPDAAPDWDEAVFSWIVRIAVPLASLPPDAWRDVSFWYIGVLDELGNELYRRDLSSAEIQALPRVAPEVILVCELQSDTIPARWKIWPVHRMHGWLPCLEGAFQDGEYSILLEEDANTPEKAGGP